MVSSCHPLYRFTSASATLTLVFQTVPANDAKLYSADDVTSVSGLEFNILRKTLESPPFMKKNIIANIRIPKITFFMLNPSTRIDFTECLDMCRFHKIARALATCAAPFLNYAPFSATNPATK